MRFGVRTVTSFIPGESREQAGGQSRISVRGIHAEALSKNALLNNDDTFSDNSSWMLCLTHLISEFHFTESIDYGDHFHGLILMLKGRRRGCGKGSGLPAESALEREHPERARRWKPFKILFIVFVSLL